MNTPDIPAVEPGRAQRQLVSRSGGAGLRQFKASFAPRWVRRYIAAPSRATLGLGCWDVLRRVRPERTRTAPD